MANIKANIKSIRKTKKRNLRNKSEISNSKSKIKKAKQTKTPADLALAFKKIDSLCAKGMIHQNKANRMKSRLAKSCKPTK